MILLRFSHNSSPVCNAELSVMKSNLRIVGGFGLRCVINLYQFWRWYWSGKKTHFGEISFEACFTRITFFVFQIFRPRLPLAVLTSENPEEKSPMKISIEFPASLISFSCISAALHTGRRQPARKKLSEALFSIKHNEKLLKLIFIRSFSFPLLLLLLLMVSLEKPTFIWLIFLFFSSLCLLQPKPSLPLNVTRIPKMTWAC